MNVPYRPIQYSTLQYIKLRRITLHHTIALYKVMSEKVSKPGIVTDDVGPDNGPRVVGMDDIAGPRTRIDSNNARFPS